MRPTSKECLCRAATLLEELGRGREELRLCGEVGEVRLEVLAAAWRLFDRLGGTTAVRGLRGFGAIRVERVRRL